MQLLKGLTKKYADDISDDLSAQLVLLKLTSTLRGQLIEIKINGIISRVIVHKESIGVNSIRTMGTHPSIFYQGKKPC